MTAGRHGSIMPIPGTSISGKSWALYKQEGENELYKESPCEEL